MQKTVLITGAARGIGRDTAFALSRRGYRVIATTHTTVQAKILQDDSCRHHVALTVHKLDITNQDDVAQVAHFAPAILINNAAIGETGPLAEIPLARVRQSFETNVFGTIAVTQAAARSMLQRGEGRIITVASLAGRIALPYMGVYNGTKFALEGMMDALRMEMHPRGIFVSIIEPGLIFTGFNERMADRKYAWLSAQSAFANDLPKMKRHDATLTAHSYSTESVVRAMFHAVESAHPKTRYIVPRSYKPTVFLSKMIPDRLRDYFVRRFMGL